LRLDPIVVDALGENDRSATGYLPKAEFEAVADDFLSVRDASVSGRERAADAQRRIVQAVENVISFASTEGNTAIVSHGDVREILLYRLKRVPVNQGED
jgi:broad specificity phosphatase PhoE